MKDCRRNARSSAPSYRRSGVFSAGAVMMCMAFCSTTALARQGAPESTAVSDAARNDDPKKRAAARSRAASAFEALDKRDHRTAIDHFTEALGLLEAPTLRVGRAEAFFQLGKWLQAKADYEAAVSYTLRPSDSTAFAESQADARAKLTALLPRLPRLQVRTTAMYADVVVDELPAVRVPVGEELPLDPGTHDVMVTVSGKSVVHSIEALPSQVLTVDGPILPVAAPVAQMTPPPVVPPTASHDTRDGSGLGTELAVSAAVTGVLAAGAVVTGILFIDTRAEYRKAQTDGTASETRLHNLYDRAETMAWINTGLIAGAVAAAGVTTYFWLAPQFANDDAAERSLRLGRALLAPIGVSLGAGSRF